MLPTKFQFFWLRGFRGIYLYRDFLHFEYICLYLNKSYLSFNRKEDFLEINQSENTIACDGHVC
jgi:hypothetical protein